MFIQRAPLAPLRPFVASLWATDTDRPAASFAAEPPRRERMLPTGAMHIVFRLGGGTLRLQGAPTAQGLATAGQGEWAGPALVGGARSRFYLRELSGASCSVGLVLRPGAALWLLGAPADALAEQHTALSDLWGAAAAALHERLCATPTAAQRLGVLEQALCARLPQAHGMHPGVAAVLQGLRPAHTVAAAVRHSGLSHRQFIAQFRRAVGLAPKAYLQVLRFQQAIHALRHASPGSAPALADVAAAAGYADQAHFSRDFLAISGVTPGAYLRMAPADANHLRLT